jgi:uncharacterized membrane protein YphA (DoxX/SURF4 family)
MNKKMFLLRAGLAFTLLYAGIDSFFHTADWVWFVPKWAGFGVFDLETVLHIHAAFEIFLGLLLLLGRKLKWVGAVVAIDMAAIILANGLDRSYFLSTFRDVGLLCVAIYLSWTAEDDRMEIRY